MGGILARCLFLLSFIHFWALPVATLHGVRVRESRRSTDFPGLPMQGSGNGNDVMKLYKYPLQFRVFATNRPLGRKYALKSPFL